LSHWTLHKTNCHSPPPSSSSTLDDSPSPALSLFKSLSEIAAFGVKIDEQATGGEGEGGGNEGRWEEKGEEEEERGGGKKGGLDKYQGTTRNQLMRKLRMEQVGDLVRFWIPHEEGKCVL
jgi:hypothetical protein